MNGNLLNWKGCKKLEQGTPEWLEARVGLCTASRAGGLLGVHPYLSANKALKQMQTAEEQEFHPTVASWLKIGTDNEPYILEQATKALRGSMTSFGKLFWIRSTPSGKLVGASPDGILHVPVHGLRLVEAKTTITQPALKPKPHHLIQCIVQMYCLNLSACYLVYDFVGGEGHLFSYYLIRWGEPCEKLMYELDDMLVNATPPIVTRSKDKERRLLLLSELDCQRFSPSS